MARPEIEHLIPFAKGGTDDEANLWLACPLCNGHTSDKIEAVDPATGQIVGLFNPRSQSWWEHFMWLDEAFASLAKHPSAVRLLPLFIWTTTWMPWPCAVIGYWLLGTGGLASTKDMSYDLSPG